MEALGAFGALGELGALGALTGAIDPALGIAVPPTLLAVADEVIE